MNNADTGVDKAPPSGSPASQGVRLRGPASTSLTALLLGLSASMVLGQAATADDDLVKLEFINCTPMQEAQVAEAFGLAAVAIDQTAASLSSDKIHPADMEAVARWFGERTSVFHILKDLKHLASRLDAGQLPIRAECRFDDRDTFAWTYQAMTGPGYISFGWHFFNAHLVGGADSRMGTVVHELSHMVPGTATDDYFYKQDQMLALARIFPEIALDNAQNVEYLVEEVFDRLNGLGAGVKSFLFRPVTPGAHLPPIIRELR
ncbi:MAG: M35 family metallo-endopeptidase [Alphaproteobacteria bacterium]